MSGTHNITVSPPEKYGIPFSWIGHTTLLAEKQGLDLRKSLFDAGVHEKGSLIENTSILGPAESMLSALFLINAVDDEMHGVAKKRMARGTASLASRIITSAKDLEDAIHAVSRLFNIAGSYCKLALEQTSSYTTLKISADISNQITKNIVEEMMAQFLNHQFSYLLDFPLPLMNFITPAADHPCMGAQHPYLLSPVRHGPVTGIIFPSVYLKSVPKHQHSHNPFWDSHLFWLAHHPATQYAIGQTGDVTSLSKTLLSNLKEFDASFADCCVEMNMSPEEVKRGLVSEGTNFRKIRRTALIERTYPHLQAGASVDDLADILGYSDSRSLRRALKQATGLTISELRQLQLNSPSNLSTSFIDTLRTQVKKLT